MNKKSQAQLIVSVIIGIILIVALFLIFWWISDRLKDLKSDDITDNQSLSVYDSYVMILGQMNSTDLDEFVDFMDTLRNKEGYVGNSWMYENRKTFEGDITKYEKQAVQRNLDSYILTLGPNDELRSFEMYPLFFNILRYDECDEEITDLQWLPGTENLHNGWGLIFDNNLKLYGTNYCRAKVVLDE